MDWISMGEHLPDESMSDFVYRSQPLLMLCHSEGFLLVPHHDFLDRLLDHTDSYTFLTFLTSKDSRFIEKIAELSTRESYRDTSNLIPVHIGIKWLPLSMDFEDLLAIFESRETDRDSTIESSWTQECLIEDIRAIGRCHDDDIGIIIESIHLREDLIERLFTLIMATTDTRASLLSDSIDLIDKYDRRRFLTSLLKEVSYTRGSDTDEHLDELRPRYREKWYFTLSCDGTSKKCLTSSRRSLEEDTARDLRTEVLILRRILQEVDDLDQICFLLIRSGHISECHLLIHLRIIDLRS